jgi:hypothetical protein
MSQNAVTFGLYLLIPKQGSATSLPELKSLHFLLYSLGNKVFVTKFHYISSAVEMYSHIFEDLSFRDITPFRPISSYPCFEKI